MDTFKLNSNLQSSTQTNQMSSGEKFYGQMRQKLSYLSTITRSVFGGLKIRISDLRTLNQPSMLVVALMLWGCVAASCMGTLHKVDGIMAKKGYLQILQRHLKSTTRWLKLGHSWIFQKDSDPKHTSKLVLMFV